MAKCQNCLNGISSAYIKDVIKGSFKKIGYYCNICNIHYNTDKKLYAVNEELYTVSKYNQNPSTGPTNIHNNKVFLANMHNNTIISNPNTQKLYKRMGNNQLGRVRSVVRISRRSSEPQTVGSKPIGPVTIMAILNGFHENKVYNKKWRKPKTTIRRNWTHGRCICMR